MTENVKSQNGNRGLVFNDIQGKPQNLLAAMPNQLRKVALARASYPDESPQFLMNEFKLKIDYSYLRRCFYDKRIMDFLKYFEVSEADHVRRLRLKSLNVIEKSMDGRTNKTQLDAAKHVSKQTFDVPIVNKTTVVILDPNEIRELAKKFLESGPENKSIDVSPSANSDPE